MNHDVGFYIQRNRHGIIVPESNGIAFLPQACLARQNGQRSELCERRNIAKQYVAERQELLNHRILLKNGELHGERQAIR